jgi:hypothetical protein
MASKPKRKKKLTPIQRQGERAMSYALQNCDFSDYKYPAGEPDWTNPQVRSEAANNVLAFNVFGADGALLEAFRGFSLNGMNPYHWRFLS